MKKNVLCLFAIVVIVFPAISFAGKYTGTVTKIQVGDGLRAGIGPLTSSSYVMVTLDPLPSPTECATDPAKRLMIDTESEHGKLMFTLITAAKLSGKTVTLSGYEECFTQSSTNNKWEKISWMVIE